MPKPQAYEPLRAKYEITDQERATIEMLLRATLQIVQPEAGEHMGQLSERSGFSRQTLFVWAGRIVFVILWMLRKMPTGRPSAKLERDVVWRWLRDATIHNADGMDEAQEVAE